jgi:plastocyanin
VNIRIVEREIARQAHFLEVQMRILMLALAATTVLGCNSDSTENTPAPVDVTIAVPAGGGAATFSPNPLTISLAGDPTVVWSNADGVTHTVTADDASFDSGTISAGARFSHTFTAPGTIQYHCTIHAGLVAVVIITG